MVGGPNSPSSLPPPMPPVAPHAPRLRRVNSSTMSLGRAGRGGNKGLHGGMLTLEELYVEVLYCVLHMIGCDAERDERDALIKHLRDAFHMTDDK